MIQARKAHGQPAVDYRGPLAADRDRYRIHRLTVRDGWGARGAGRVGWPKSRAIDDNLLPALGRTGGVDQQVVAVENYAVARPEKYGTWGGLNEDERSAERRRRMRRANAA